MALRTVGVPVGTLPGVRRYDWRKLTLHVLHVCEDAASGQVARKCVLTAYYALLTTHCSPLTTYYLLLTADCSLLTAFYLLRSTYYSPSEKNPFLLP